MATKIIYTYAVCEDSPSLSCSVDGAPVRVTGEPADSRADCSGPTPHRWVYVTESAEQAGWQPAGSSGLGDTISKTFALQDSCSPAPSLSAWIEDQRGSIAQGELADFGPFPLPSPRFW